MSQNICNICGANYEYRNGRWKCPACGAFKAEELSNEEVTLFYNAAQKLRLCDFDEAEKAYTDIIEKFPKNPNGYWERLLSRYGIKYEEDFDGRKIPTCYAASIESVLNDKDYIKALALADADTKAYFEQQAQYIERVRKEWIERARKEKPYDIFICYKDSDRANGIERTQDSIAAQDLYIHLTEQGYRVFFSRESLRDKVGEKYEPYIFNALSTAKVMLVYGTSSEYITSTWLKNEWTRYEKRLQAGEKKPNSLIVACDGFSPDELPKTLSSMQCFDATRRSFYTDLDAVLKRIIKAEEKPKFTNDTLKKEPIKQTSSAEVPKKKAATTPKVANKKTLPKKAKIAIIVVTIIAVIGVLGLLGQLGNDGNVDSLTDSKYGVTITAQDKIFDENSKITVGKTTDGVEHRSWVNAVKNAKGIELQNAIVYDISCDVNITENVTVKVPYSKASANTEVKVFYVSDNKTTIEEHSCSYANHFVEFETNHFSHYVVGEVVSTTTIECVGIRTITFTDKFTAEYVLASWERGAATEASIIEIMDEYGSEQGGGQLYIIEPGDFIEEIDEWCFSSERKVGDYAIIENAYGFSLCYISSINNPNALDISTVATLEKGVLQVGVCADYPPYEYMENGEYKGIEIDIVKAIAKELGLTVRFENAAFEDLLTNLTNKSVDCIIGVTETDERNELASPSYTMFSEDDYEYIIYFDKSAAELKTKVNETINKLRTDGTINTIYNQYTVKSGSVKVIFDPNGGEGTRIIEFAEKNTSITMKETVFTRPGYTFLGWGKYPGGEAIYKVGTYYEVGSDLEYVIYAIWRKNKNTIVFDANGGVGQMESDTVETGSGASLPASTFTREGYTFLGWSEDPLSVEPEYKAYDVYWMGTEPSVTLYAIWQVNENSIVFNANGGSGTMENQKLETNETGTLSKCTLNRAGYLFAGWATTASGEVAYVDQAEYTMGTSSENILYAVWIIADYRITYELNEGINNKDNPVGYDVIDETITLKEPSRNGYTFNGWFSDASCKNAASSIPKGSTGDKKFYASWTPNQNTISFDANGGEGRMDDMTGATDSVILLPYSTFSRQGYKFMGWAVSSTGSKSYSEGGTYTVGKDSQYILYAVWQANTNTPYTVNHYKANLDAGYTLDETETLYGTTDSKVSPSRLNYYGFDAPSAKEITISPDGSAVVNYYYARTEYTVTYVTNGGNQIGTQTYKYEQTVSLSKATRSGYSFGGWFSDEALTNQVNQLSMNENKTVYAWWAEENKPSDFDYSKSGTRVVVYEYVGSDEVMVIPSYIGGSPVTTIAASAFKGNTVITSATLPEQLGAISDNMFEDCTSLTEVKSFNAVSSIGKYAFSGCTSLKRFNSTKDYELIINDGVETIGTYAFKNVSLVQKIVVPNSVTRINEAAFNGCDGLKDLTIPFVGRERNDTTYYNNLGFIFSEEYRYSEPEGSTRQDTYDTYHYPFMIPLGIERITVTDTTFIGRGAFQNLNFVKSITIDCAVEQIDCNAFSGLTTSTTIIYSGTMEEWQAIEKYDAPLANWGGNYLNFSCDDGTVTGG